MTQSRSWVLLAAAALLLGGPVVRACDKDNTGAAKGKAGAAVQSSCDCCCAVKASKCDEKYKGKCCACECVKAGCCEGKCNEKCKSECGSAGKCQKAGCCAGKCGEDCQGKCCAACQCAKTGCCAAAKLPKCTCPAGTKCAAGCTPDACCCVKEKGDKKKAAVYPQDCGGMEGIQKAYIGGCLMEMAPMPRPMAEGQPPMPPFGPMLMWLESMCPQPPCLPPPPFHGLMPAGFPPPPPPCCADGCPCLPEASCLSLSHEADGIHISSPYLQECVCKKVSLCGPMGCLMLENVKLVAGTDGKKIHIVADKLCLDPRTGRIQLEATSPSSSSVMPACFQFWGGVFD
jgi:hypothetical protein